MLIYAYQLDKRKAAWYAMGIVYCLDANSQTVSSIYRHGTQRRQAIYNYCNISSHEVFIGSVDEMTIRTL